MKSKILSSLSIAALLTVGAFAQAADTSAPTANSVVAGPTKVAIINIQAAIANTNEGQRDLDALQKKFEPKQIELKSLNDEVDNLKKQLSTQTSMLSEDERSKRVQTIEEKQKKLQRDLEDAQNDYQTQSNEIAQRIGTKLMKSLDEYASKNGFSVVIDVSTQGSPVLWAAPSTDITKPVIEAYNQVSGVPAPVKSAATTPASPSSVVRRPAATTTAPAAPKPASSTTTPK